MTPRCRNYVARKVLDAVVLLVALAVLIFAGSLVRDAYFAKADAAPPRNVTTQERMDRIEDKLDYLLALPSAAQDGV